MAREDIQGKVLFIKERNCHETTEAEYRPALTTDPIGDILSSIISLRFVADQLEATDLYGPAHLLSLLAGNIQASVEQMDNENWKPAGGVNHD